METAGKFWNFYDVLGGCVYSVPFSEGDTRERVEEDWFAMIDGEEYKPEADSLVLENFKGDEQ